MKEQFSHLVKSAASNIFSHFFAFRATRVKDFAPCKGIQDSLGFWIPCCGFRIPSTGFRIQAQWIPDSKKSWIPFFSPGFNTFLRTSFSCWILNNRLSVSREKFHVMIYVEKARRLRSNLTMFRPC